MRAPSASRSAIRYSSRSPEQTIRVSAQPAVVEHGAHARRSASPGRPSRSARPAGRSPVSRDASHGGVRAGQRVVGVDQERRALRDGGAGTRRTPRRRSGTRGCSCGPSSRWSARRTDTRPRRSRSPRSRRCTRPGPRGAPASAPCARRKPKSTTGRPAAAVDDPAGLGGDQRLEVDLVQEQRLGELARQEVALDAQDRLAGVHDRALRDRRQVAGERDRRQPREQRRRADPRALEVRQRLVAEPQLGEHLDRALEAGGDQVAAIGRQLAGEELERDRLGSLPSARYESAIASSYSSTSSSLGGGGDHPDRR